MWSSRLASLRGKPREGWKKKVFFSKLYPGTQVDSWKIIIICALPFLPEVLKKKIGLPGENQVRSRSNETQSTCNDHRGARNDR